MISLLQEAAHTAAEHTESVASSVAHGQTETATGLPQLDTATFANQIFWLIVTMLVLYWVVAKVALPRIGAVLSDRQGAITGDLMAAEEFKLKAKEAEAAYDKALADARAEAGKIVAANRAEIQKELDAAIAHADAEISARAAESRICRMRVSDSAARAAISASAWAMAASSSFWISARFAATILFASARASASALS